MRRKHLLRHRLFIIASGVSLLLWMCVCVCWVRSYFVWNDVHWFGPAWYQRHYHLPRLGSLRSVNGGACVRWHSLTWLPSGDEYRPTEGRPIGVRLERYEPRGGYPALRGPGIVPSGEPPLAWRWFGIDAVYFENNMERGQARCRAVVFPYWMPALLLAAMPAQAARAAWCRRRRALRGVCAACGYDLRATPDRCPECGAVAQAQPEAAA